MYSMALNINSIWHLPAVGDVTDAVGAQLLQYKIPKYKYCYRLWLYRVWDIIYSDGWYNELPSH